MDHAGNCTLFCACDCVADQRFFNWIWEYAEGFGDERFTGCSGSCAVWMGKSCSVLEVMMGL